MVNRHLLRQYDLPEGELQQELEAAFSHGGADWLPPEEQAFQDNRLVTGRVRRVTGDEVWVDVGDKSEGAVEIGVSRFREVVELLSEAPAGYPPTLGACTSKRGWPVPTRRRCSGPCAARSATASSGCSRWPVAGASGSC